jgi:hypothetical protein
MIKKIISFFKDNKFFVLLLVLTTLIQTRYLFESGMYTFSDEVHFANLYEMIRGFLGGQFPPRWAPDMSYNFGYPLFNFYYPLPFYLASFFYLVFHFSLIDSLKSVFFLSVIFSGISFYFLANKFFSKTTAFFVSIIYLYTPYRAVDLYVRGAIGELWSFVFMPLVLLSIYNLIKSQNIKNVIFVSVSVAGLIMSHNLSAIIFLPVALVFGLTFLIKETKIFNKIVFIGGGLLMGFGISAYYWLPAVLEKRFIQPGTPFNPFDHFPFISQLIIPSWGYGASVWGPTDMMSFQIGLVNLGLLLFSIIIFSFYKKLFNRDQKCLLFFSLIVFALSIILMNIRSWFLWEILPLGSYLQFPWRLLMLTTLVTPLLGGFLEIIPNKKIGITLLSVFAIFSIILTFNYFMPATILKVNDNYYLNRFFINQNTQNNPEIRSNIYQNNSEDYLPLTIWTKIRPSGFTSKIIISEGGEIVKLEEIKPTESLVAVKNSKPVDLTINIYYFPGWKVYVDNKESSVEILEPYGNMNIKIAEGVHTVLIRFEETIVRKVADGFSVIAVILMLVGIYYEKRNHKKNQ